MADATAPSGLREPAELEESPSPIKHSVHTLELNQVALVLSQKAHRSRGMFRLGVGNDVDSLTVRQARDTVQSIDKELARMGRMRETLIELKSEIQKAVQ